MELGLQGEKEPGKGCSQQDPQREQRPWGGNKPGFREAQGEVWEVGRERGEPGSLGPSCLQAQGRDGMPGAVGWQSLNFSLGSAAPGPARAPPLWPRSQPCLGAGRAQGCLPWPLCPPRHRTGRATPMSQPRGPGDCGFPLSNRRTPRAGEGEISPKEGAAFHTQGSAPQAAPSPALESASPDLASNPTLIL